MEDEVVHGHQCDFPTLLWSHGIGGGEVFVMRIRRGKLVDFTLTIDLVKLLQQESNNCNKYKVLYRTSANDSPEIYLKHTVWTGMLSGVEGMIISPSSILGSSDHLGGAWWWYWVQRAFVLGKKRRWASRLLSCFNLLYACNFSFILIYFFYSDDIAPV